MKLIAVFVKSVKYEAPFIAYLDSVTLQNKIEQSNESDKSVLKFIFFVYRTDNSRKKKIDAEQRVVVNFKPHY